MPKRKKSKIEKDNFLNILDVASEMTQNPTDGTFPSLEKLEIFWNSVKNDPKDDDLVYLAYLASDPCERLKISLKGEEEKNYTEVVKYANAVLTDFSKKFYK